MKYENITRATEICDEIAKKERMVSSIMSSHDVVLRSVTGLNEHTTEFNLKLHCADPYTRLAFRYRDDVIRQLEKEIQSLHLELAPL